MSFTSKRKGFLAFAHSVFSSAPFRMGFSWVAGMALPGGCAPTDTGGALAGNVFAGLCAQTHPHVTSRAMEMESGWFIGFALEVIGP